MLFKKKGVNRTLRELAVKNVRKSAEDYLIYFFTLTFAVSLFYTFNSIEEQFMALELPDTYNFLAAAESVMMACSVLVCLIIGFLIIYSNSFLMKRRKREFAVYGVLGMEQKDIGLLLAKETIRVGGFSLICGLPLGVAVSQLLALVTTRLANGSVEKYRFVFSIKAVFASVLFFVLIFVVVHIFRLREIRKMKLIDLLQADRKNEEIGEGRKAGVLLCLLALVFISIGYGVIFHWNSWEIFKAAAVSGGFIIFGTVLFFLSAAAVLFRAVKKRKGFYYRNLNSFVVNQLGSRMRKEGFSLAVVCVLMYLSVSVMGTGTGLGQSFIKEKYQMAPFDLSVIYYYDGVENLDDAVKRESVRAVLGEQKAEVAQYLEKTEEITCYTDEGNTMQQVFGKYEKETDPEKRWYGSEPLYLVGVDDYNKMREFCGKPPVTLGESEYALNYNEPETEELLKEYLSQKETLNISGTTLSLKENGLYRMTIYNRNVYLDIGTLIVPQKIAEQNKPFMSIMNAMIAGDKAIVNEAVHRDELRMNVGGFLFNSQEDLFIEFLSNQLMLSYLGIYLGITFLITAGAVLALQQLTQTADNEKRYKLLYQLGVDADAMRKTLKMQLGIYFGLPFLVAAIHSGITMYGVYQDVPYLTSRDIAQNVLFAAGLAVVVYSIYLVTTYAGCKRILKL